MYHRVGALANRLAQAPAHSEPRVSRRSVRGALAVGPSACLAAIIRRLRVVHLALGHQPGSPDRRCLLRVLQDRKLDLAPPASNHLTELDRRSDLAPAIMFHQRGNSQRRHHSITGCPRTLEPSRRSRTMNLAPSRRKNLVRRASQTPRRALLWIKLSDRRKTKKPARVRLRPGSS